MNLPAINCKDAARLMSESKDRSLTFSERIGLFIHKHLCKPCVKFDEQIEHLHQMGKSIGDNINDSSARLNQIAAARIRKNIIQEIAK